jgi:hypothetical protein
MKIKMLFSLFENASWCILNVYIVKLVDANTMCMNLHKVAQMSWSVLAISQTPENSIVDGFTKQM